MNSGLLPSAQMQSGTPAGRLSFAAGNRLLILLGAGLLFLPLMFVSSLFGWGMLLWDACCLTIFVLDLRSLPKAKDLTVDRDFSGALHQHTRATISLRIGNASPVALKCELQDDVPPEISVLPYQAQLTIPPNTEVVHQFQIEPRNRGQYVFGAVYLRVESALGLAQRWIKCDVQQAVRVYPRLNDTREQSIMLLRSRQMELQLRLLRQRGQGREFESLRDFQHGDELRDVCWTATARRSKFVTTLRQRERSQTVWSVIDCGRLMRARVHGRSKLDYAAETSVRLAQLANFSGDNSAMLAYGSSVQRRSLPGRGEGHLRSLLDQLALICEETAEADHLRAAGAVMNMQKRRCMLVWITDLADTAITPEIVSATLHAAKRHLVVVAVIGNPDLRELVSKAPQNDDDALLYAAAAETIARRDLMLAMLRSRGVHALEVSAPELTGAVLRQYLQLKQKNLL